MSEFLLDNRLKVDCLAIGELELCLILLMNDKRWPWIILVPKIKRAEEIHHLDVFTRQLLQHETSRAGEILARVSGCEKINYGALGNIVRQLHVHIIARSRGDENWPGPVWGYGERQPYLHEEADQMVKKLEGYFV